MRRCLIAIDMMETTNWLPEHVVHHSRRVTLESIFKHAGLELLVERGEETVPIPSTGEVLDLGQLHGIMTKLKRRASSEWSAHVLIATRIKYRAGGRPVEPLGVMYDIGTANTNNVAREGCAISFQRIRGLDDDRAYLRTIAHELGHVFNLEHPEKETPPLPSGTSIMNSTRTLQDFGGFPDNIDFVFEASQSEWLANGPADYVRPGGQPFRSRPTPAGTEETPSNTIANDLELMLSSRREEIVLGEPFLLRFTLRNASNASVLVDPHLSLHSPAMSLKITDPEKRTRQFRPPVITCGGAQAVRLAPGRELLSNSMASFDGSGQVFPRPGAYMLRAEYLPEDLRGSRVVSNTLTIDVRCPTTIDGRELADFASLPLMGLLSVLRGGRHLKDAATTWASILRARWDAPALQCMKIVLAEYELSSHTGRAAAQRSLDYLSTARSEDLDYEQRAEMAGLCAEAAGRLGLTREAERAKQEQAVVASKLGPPTV